MLSKLLIVGLAVLITACVPIPQETPVAWTSTPIPQPVHTPAGTVQPVDCVMHGGSPPPTLPDTDCRAWEMLHSLLFMADMMANKSQGPTASELVAFEEELYPLFVQAQRNCDEWLEPYVDYEPITDYLGIIMAIGKQEYDYDPPSLLRFLIEEASTEEFAEMSESTGCTKNLFLLFVAYAE